MSEAPNDEVDVLVSAWRRERPDLDVGPLEVLSRVSRLARHLDLARREAFAAHGLEPWEFDVLAALRREGVSPAAIQVITKELRRVFDFRRSRAGDGFRLAQASDGRVLDFHYSQGSEESYSLTWKGTRYAVAKQTATLESHVAKIAGVVLVALQGLSSAEAAVVQGCSRGTVSWRLHEGHKRLLEATHKVPQRTKKPLSEHLGRLLVEAGLFANQVTAWLAAKHPELG
mgnify:CR=1 FL=1